MQGAERIMPLQHRHIAIKTSVIFFFMFCLLGLASRLSPYTCCKRALAAAIITYLLAAIVVKIINTVIIEAMISKHLDKHINERNSNK